MNAHGRRFVLAAALALPSMPAGAVRLEFVDRAQLQAVLESGAPCCVIDARSEKARKHQPIAHALAYEEGMTLSPAGPVVVVGDSDKQTLAVEQARLKSTLPLSFIIPSDTCQQGPPLQQLRFDRR
jgi:hypothetical protein